MNTRKGNPIKLALNSQFYKFGVLWWEVLDSNQRGFKLRIYSPSHSTTLATAHSTRYGSRTRLSRVKIWRTNRYSNRAYSDFDKIRNLYAWSGWCDSNTRFLQPKCSGLTRLSHTLKTQTKCLRSTPGRIRTCNLHVRSVML